MLASVQVVSMQMATCGQYGFPVTGFNESEAWQNKCSECKQANRWCLVFAVACRASMRIFYSLMGTITASSLDSTKHLIGLLFI